MTAPILAMNTNSSTTDVAPFAIIDCGASWSVMGQKRLINWARLTSHSAWRTIATPSLRKFRFGSLELFPSLGSVLTNAIVLDSSQNKHRFVPNLDVIDNPIPLLTSRISLVKMAAVIDSREQILTSNGATVLNTRTSSGGRTTLRLFPARTQVLRQCDSQAIYHTDNPHLVDIVIGKWRKTPN